MTAEIAVMNQSAAALAADSAATSPDGKIFTANKIFALSKHQPVAVMIYGAASCMGVPWETVIKEYRAELGETNHPTIAAYAADFLRFMGSHSALFPSAQQSKFAYQTATQAFRPIREEIDEQARATIGSAGALTEARLRAIATAQTKAHRAIWRKEAPRPRLPREYRQRLGQQYRAEIDQAIRDVFEHVPRTKSTTDSLVGIALDAYCKGPREGRSGRSGIVFAGFGVSEMFPALVSYQLNGILLNRVAARQVHSTAMHHGTASMIVPFAQEDMFRLFLEGVTPQYEAFIEAYVERVLAGFDAIMTETLPVRHVTPAFRKQLAVGREKLLAAFYRDLSQQRQRQYSDPVLSIVANLPMDELASLAESLVNLTSLRRRVSRAQETVGGPVDVAVISRGDGLVWIKRKHYFAAELNPQFFAKHYGRSR